MNFIIIKYYITFVGICRQHNPHSPKGAGCRPIHILFGMVAGPHSEGPQIAALRASAQGRHHEGWQEIQ